MTGGRATWTNWVGNQSFVADLATPRSEGEVVEHVRAAIAAGKGIRAAGTGHSCTPVVQSDTVLATTGLRGITHVDAARRYVTALAGTTVGEFGEPLWTAGLAFANQGDIDTQAIAGAIATGTHGSGNALPSFSATLRACRLVDGRGEVVEIDDTQPERLRAAQVAIGMLGVMTSVTVEVVPAYRLAERIEHWRFAEVRERWDELFATHRHFSFFWLPSEASAELYGLATPAGSRMTDTCYVRVYDEAGDALADQGDIDTQAIAGAIATGTHGSGNELPSLSATLRACRLVDGRGELVEIDETQPELLRAAQVSLGLLGVMTSLTIEVVPAYRLAERIEHWPLSDVLERWDELFAAHRHFSFFWLPSEQSAVLYGLATPAGRRMTDTCYVKVYDEAGEDVPDDATANRRVDRSYRIYPAEFEANFHELEYFVPRARGREAVEAMRELMLASQPDAVFPMEVRSTAADEAFLSSNCGTPTTVISVSGTPGTDYWPYLRAVDRLLGSYGARVHWGKLHFLTPAQLAERYPESARFIAIRREFDPGGVFLNDHLRVLFA